MGYWTGCSHSDSISLVLCVNHRCLGMDVKGILMSDALFYGSIVALCLVFTGHPFLAVLVFLIAM
jgi:hypothetical protein